VDDQFSVICTWFSRTRTLKVGLSPSNPISLISQIIDCVIKSRLFEHFWTTFGLGSVIV